MINDNQVHHLLSLLEFVNALEREGRVTAKLCEPQLADGRIRHWLYIVLDFNAAGEVIGFEIEHASERTDLKNVQIS